MFWQTLRGSDLLEEKEHTTETPPTVNSPGLPSDQSASSGLPSDHPPLEVMDLEKITQRAAEAADVIQRMKRAAAAGDEDIVRGNAKDRLGHSQRVWFHLFVP